MKRIISLFLFVNIFFVFMVSVTNAAQVTLAWDASTGTNVTGYKIYVSKVSGVYGPSSSAIDVGKVLTYTVTSLDEGTKFYFVATAYNPGAESSFSNEVNTTTPWSKPPPPNMKPIQAVSASLDSAKQNISRYMNQNNIGPRTVKGKLLNAAMTNIDKAKTNLKNFLVLSLSILMQEQQEQTGNLRIIASN